MTRPPRPTPRLELPTTVHDVDTAAADEVAALLVGHGPPMLLSVRDAIALRFAVVRERAETMGRAAAEAEMRDSDAASRIEAWAATAAVATASFPGPSKHDAMAVASWAASVADAVLLERARRVKGGT